MKSIEACTEKRWSVLTWKKDDGENPSVHPFRCKSWRHEGACREHCAACDFARIAQAVTENKFWVYMVITYPAREWPNVTELFKAGVVHWSRLRKRLDYEYGAIKYIQTWEIHRSGYPHVNVIISNENLYNSTIKDSFRLKKDVIDPMAQEVGFGFVRWLEPVKCAERMSSYLVKLSLELTGTGKFNQLPINAPKHFRRLRSSRNLLPKRIKNDTITGCLMRLPADDVLRQLGEEPVATKGE